METEENMELERMRRILAERAMGWTISHTNLGAAALALWNPFEDAGQMMDVVDAMRAKGWMWCVEDLVEDAISATVRHYDGREGLGVAETEREARMLAAARALESERPPMSDLTRWVAMDRLRDELHRIIENEPSGELADLFEMDAWLNVLADEVHKVQSVIQREIKRRKKATNGS